MQISWTLTRAFIFAKTHILKWKFPIKCLAIVGLNFNFGIGIFFYCEFNIPNSHGIGHVRAFTYFTFWNLNVFSGMSIYAFTIICSMSLTMFWGFYWYILIECSKLHYTEKKFVIKCIMIANDEWRYNYIVNSHGVAWSQRA